MKTFQWNSYRSDDSDYYRELGRCTLHITALDVIVRWCNVQSAKYVDEEEEEKNMKFNQREIVLSWCWTIDIIVDGGGKMMRENTETDA